MFVLMKTNAFYVNIYELGLGGDDVLLFKKNIVYLFWLRTTTFRNRIIIGRGFLAQSSLYSTNISRFEVRA